jgi:hypothetical protein
MRVAGGVQKSDARTAASTPSANTAFFRSSLGTGEPEQKCSSNRLNPHQISEAGILDLSKPWVFYYKPRHIRAGGAR